MEGLLFKVCGVALISAMLITLLRKLGSEQAVMLKLISGVAVAALSVAAISPVIEFIRELSAMSESVADYAELMLRALSVAITTHVCAVVCRDCGEGSLASYVEMGGKVEILLLSLPYVKGLINGAVGMM